jgi:hypothetical protein
VLSLPVIWQIGTVVDSQLSLAAWFSSSVSSFKLLLAAWASSLLVV